MEVSSASVSGLRVPRAPRPDRSLRVIQVGLLGLGNVGQAVVRAAAAASGPLRDRGLGVSIAGVLVRDVGKSRRCPRVARITNNAEAFMRGRYDVVIDALAGAEPAGALAGRLLGKGVPVVSANKVLVAAEGARLRGIAARAGTTLRVEAAVMAGVPFVGAFERRPLAAHVTQFTGIVNGTSHFILSRVAQGAAFETALAEAQALGYAEPNPDADVSGRDALEKLFVLAEVLLGSAIRPATIAAEGITNVTPDALAAARALGGVLKPVVLAARRPASGLTAFAGPAWMHASHPLSAVTGRDTAILIDSRFSGRLMFAGPGAGPDITAATLLDDAIEAAGEKGALCVNERHEQRRVPDSVIHPPDTGWFMRLTGGAASSRAALIRLQLTTAGVAVTAEAIDAAGISLISATASAERISALTAVFRAQGFVTHAWRVIHA
jgi:homoserine dehydrogenase